MSAAFLTCTDTADFCSQHVAVGQQTMHPQPLHTHTHTHPEPAPPPIAIAHNVAHYESESRNYISVGMRLISKDGGSKGGREGRNPLDVSYIIFSRPGDPPRTSMNSRIGFDQQQSASRVVHASTSVAT